MTTRSLREFTRFIWWMQRSAQAAVDPQTKPRDLGCESACRQLSSTTTIAIYYYSARDVGELQCWRVGCQRVVQVPCQLARILSQLLLRCQIRFTNRNHRNGNQTNMWQGQLTYLQLLLNEYTGYKQRHTSALITSQPYTNKGKKLKRVYINPRS